MVRPVKLYAADPIREGMVVRWVRSESRYLARHVDEWGWTYRTICRVCQLSNTLIDVFGPGPYKIVRLGPMDFVGDRARRRMRR